MKTGAGLVLLTMLVLLTLGCSSGARDSATAQPTEPEIRADASACAVDQPGVVLQVLGSGGPMADDGRASTSYLVWVDGRARVLVDAGGGLLPRFGASRADLADIDAVAISHMHVDHVAGLIGLLKHGYFTKRTRPLALIGPSGSTDYPAIDDWLASLLDPTSGAFRYLSGYLTGDGLFRIDTRTQSVASGEVHDAFQNERLKIQTTKVTHATVPALGYLVTVGDLRLAFAGDQSATGNEAFAQLIDGADILVAHHPIPETGAENLEHLHATPSQVGRLAARAHVGRLVLSHHMQRALERLEDSRTAIASEYEGPVVVAEDLVCLSVGG